ncbi:glycosyltransferase family 4 protein [Egicoccus halophilus]|uniref:Glycosyltransferase WbuB n=1 Tax=Egicoccus halophilus TaxID=1670830 RepID=A0A8J3AAA0_9ACTN|nr:glycosyltransferase family 4 protein [Egicoccus halophilus]GGI05985.1 glycosyltransferase WbuB [Egicoccus halophilus]
MTLARLLRALARRATTDPVGAANLVVTRVRDEPAHVLVRVLGMLPTAARRRLVVPLRTVGRLVALVAPHAGWPLLLQLVALDLAGERDAAVAVATRRGERLSATGRLTVAGWLAEVERPHPALALVEPLAAVPRVQRVRGRIRWRAGHWEAARDELTAALDADPRPTTRRTLHRVAEDLRALEPGWLPSVGRLARQAPRPGRAVHLLNNALPQVQAGYTLRAHRVALAQRDQGIDPVMVTKLGFPWRQGLADAGERDVVDGIPYVHVPDPGGDTVFGTAERVERSVARTGPVVAALRPAVLHPTTPYDNAQVMLALGRALDVPVVYEVRGFLEETWLSRHPGVRGLEQVDRYRRMRATEGWCAAQADHVVTLGEAMKADLVRRGVEARRITVVPNAVDTDVFRPQGRGGPVRDRLGLPEGRVLLGYISSLVPYEGVEVLLRGVRHLLDRGRDVAVVVVGDGTARAGWEHEAAELGLGERATFTGRVPHEEIQAFYEAIDVFVVPRRDERVCRNVTPLKPVEAMALERCVVVSDLPALAEMVEEGVTGRTFRAEDPVDLADVVEPLLDDPGTRARFGRAARGRVVAERTWAANGRRYAEIYRALGG